VIGDHPNRRVVRRTARVALSGASMQNLIRAALVLFATCHAVGAAADTGNTRLEQNLQICANCHGAPAFDNPTKDNFLVPRLGGQQAGYLIKALKAYKTGQRDHLFMRGIAASLSEEEMRELANYFSSQQAIPRGEHE
jgi:cytochrome c553